MVCILEVHHDDWAADNTAGEDPEIANIEFSLFFCDGNHRIEGEEMDNDNKIMILNLYLRIFAFVSNLRIRNNV